MLAFGETSRIQGDSQTIGSTALVPIKTKGPERTGKAPTTPVKTHLGAQKIPLKTLTSQHQKLLLFSTELWEQYFKLQRINHNLLNNIQSISEILIEADTSKNHLLRSKKKSKQKCLQIGETKQGSGAAYFYF